MSEPKEAIYWPHALVIAVLSLASIAPLFWLDLQVSYLFGFQIEQLLAAVLPVLLILPLPIAYIDRISRERFRKETLAVLIVAPVGAIGLQFAAFASGLVLGALLTSWKAKSIYNGRNRFWTYFKASGATITLLAIAIGLAASTAYAEDAQLQDAVQSNLSAQVISFAGTLSGDAQQAQQTVIEEQKDGIKDLAGTLAANISQASIISTRALVMQNIQADGSFSPRQQSVVHNTFTNAENMIPSEMQRQATEQIDAQFAAQETSNPITADLNERMQGPVETMIADITAPSQETNMLVFFTTFSFIILFKFPFELLGAIYAFIFDGVSQLMARRTDEPDADESD